MAKKEKVRWPRDLQPSGIQPKDDAKMAHDLLVVLKRITDRMLKNEIRMEKFLKQYGNDDERKAECVLVRDALKKTRGGLQKIGKRVQSLAIDLGCV